MINRIKRVFSFALAILILNASVLSAANVNDFMMGNVTDGQSWTDATTGVNYTSGARAVYKFKRTATFAPWAVLKAPSMGVSCTGFSMDLGFIGIMNLDNIGEQLKEAGEAFMWGLLTVFKLSTPNLSKVFEYINQIIRSIQDMLRNACQMGAKLSQSMAKKFGVGDGEGINLMGPLDDALGSMGVDDMSSSLNKSFGEMYDDSLDEWASKPLEERNSNINSFFGAATGEIASSGALNNGLLPVTNYLYTSAREFSDLRPKFITSTLGDVLDGKFKEGTEEFQWTSDDTVKNELKAKYIISRHLFGEYIMPASEHDKIANVFGIDVSSDTDWEKHVKEMAEDVKGGKTLLTLTKGSFVPGAISQPDDVIDFLLDPKDKKITIVNEKAVLLMVSAKTKYNDSGDKVPPKPYYAVYLVEEKGEASLDTIDLEFDGFYEISNKGVRYLIEQHLPSDMSVSEDFNIWPGGTRVDPTSINGPLYDPLIAEKARAIALNARATKNLMMQSYIEKLVELNAYLLAKSFYAEAYAMFSRIRVPVAVGVEGKAGLTRSPMESVAPLYRQVMDGLDKKIAKIQYQDEAFNEAYDRVLNKAIKESLNGK